ncbi:hypothetical protein B0H16DRAFT_704572 [Mycena metata]|uniref:Uncharacterized protein n=1 Tax=Mycena metata TaxID=1033252 RepID=A0AAD7GTM1_9AGAR|nr:hypothetical protein B0H16DRAFT_704572 [Mycena metata]
MPAVSLYTTAPALSEADLVLDTQINLLPFSPQLIRMSCASQQLYPDRPATAPIVPTPQIGSADLTSALLARAGQIAVHLAAGKVVVIKNGDKIWPSTRKSRSSPSDSDDIHIVFTDSNWKSAETPSDTNLNARAVSLDILQSWPSEFVIDVTTNTVLETQNILRRIIGKYIPRRLVGLSADMMFKPYLHRQRLRVVIALGGLSECGKSSMGSFIGTQFSQQGRREKFAYLLDNVTKQLGFDIYTLPDTVQAHVLIQQIEDYSKAHYWVSALSLESLHRFGSIAETKRILGSLLQIVYVDVTETERIKRQISRVGEALAKAKIQELKDKDIVKRKRGAERVRDIADLILDNNASFLESSSVLEEFIDTKLKQQ